MLEIINKALLEFCMEFLSHPYLCYTEHGQHALFFSRLYSSLPEERRYINWKQQKICIIQKEYPTAENLDKIRRQHWDVSIIKQPNTDQANKSYDYFQLLAAVEFGMNASPKHLFEDIRRLLHRDSNVEHGFIVHLYRLSEPGHFISGRDLSYKSSQILSPDQVKKESIGNSVNIYYGRVGSEYEKDNGVWFIKDGKMKKLS